jgi:hypothetical protein
VAAGPGVAEVRRRAEELLAAGVRPGDALHAADLVDELAILATGAIAVLDGGAAPPTAEPGGDPDAFERAWRAVDPAAVAIEVGGIAYTHENLVAAVRSLALATGAGPGSTVLVDLPVTVPGAYLLAPLTGATRVAAGRADVVLDAERARTVPGYAGVVELDGRLLPGVAVDGAGRVRGDAVAPGRRTGGGWLEVA